jgi:hypothetical protein
MEANLQKVSSIMTLSRDPAEIKAALEGQLTVSGKPVLVCKGADTGQTVQHIFRAFAFHRDMSNETFKLSRAQKGLVHRDQFGCISKLTNYQFEKYLERFFCFAELITSGEGTHLKFSKEPPALALTTSCPRFSAALWQQRRWLLDSTLALFEWADQ